MRSSLRSSASHLIDSEESRSQASRRQGVKESRSQGVKESRSQGVRSTPRASAREDLRRKLALGGPRCFQRSCRTGDRTARERIVRGCTARCVTIFAKLTVDSAARTIHLYKQAFCSCSSRAPEPLTPDSLTP